MTTLSEQVSSAVSVLENASKKAEQFVESAVVIQTQDGPRDSIPLMIDKLNAEVAKTETAQNRLVAESARDKAISASSVATNMRDAALIQAGVYIDEPTGRAAVADGVAFKVQGTGDIAAYEYRRVNASSSSLIATYPSKKAYDKILSGYSLSRQYPNLHNDPLFEDAELNWPTTSIYEVVTYNNRKCIHVLPGATGYSRIYEPAELGSSKFSAALRIEGKSTGSSAGGRVILVQYSSTTTSSQYELGRQTYNFSQQSISTPTVISFDNIDVIAGCVAICVYLDASNGNDFYISEFVIVGGVESGYRHNIQLTNLWPEPIYADASNIGGGVSTSIDNNIYTLSISNTTTDSYAISTHAIGVLSPGEKLSFGCDVYSDTHDAAQIEAVFYNASGVEISRKTKDNDATLFSWKAIRIAFEIPAETRMVEFRHNLRYQTDIAGGQIAKFRKTFVKSRSGLIDYEFGGYFSERKHALKLSGENSSYRISKIVDGLAGEFASPNIYLDPLFVTGIYNNGACSIDFINGERCLKISTGEISSGFIDRYKIDGDTFSCGFTIAKSNQDFGRVLVMQLDANHQQISVDSPYRLTKTITKSVSSDNQEDVLFSDVIIHPDCKYFQFYYDSGVSNVLWINKPWIRQGIAGAFVHPMPKIPNYWPDPNWTGNKLSTTSSNAGSDVEHNYGIDVSPVLKLTITNSLVVRRYNVDAVGVLMPYAKPWLSAKVKSNGIGCAEVGVLYFDSTGNEISRQLLKNQLADDVNWQTLNFRLSVPETCSLVQFRFVAWNNTTGTFAAFKDVTLTEYPVAAAWQAFNLCDDLTFQKQTKGTVFIAADGSDDNSGSYSSPVKTFTKASEIIGGYGRIVYKSGDYDVTSAINMSVAENVEVFAEKLGAVRFILGLKISEPFTLVDGKTKVWEAALTTAPNKYIFEHNTPEGLITYSERSPLHRGRTHRLPSYRIKNASSIDAIESSSTPRWFYDSIAKKIYLSTVNGDDPNTHEYYLPRNAVVTGGSAGKRVQVVGIHAWYGHFNFSNFDYYQASDLFAMGANAAGCIVRDQSRGVEHRNEACASDNDGTNMHNPGLSEPVTPGAVVPPASTIVTFDNYCHDNYDDGDSCHERCEGQYVGGLMEYNGDRGIATSYGAHVTAIGITTRKNGREYQGQSLRSAGEGFGVLGNAAATEGGTGTEMHCISCTSISDKVGFSALNANCKLIADNCRTINCETAYNAEDSASLLILRDCRDSGSAVLKGAGVGTITVDNGTLVV